MINKEISFYNDNRTLKIPNKDTQNIKAMLEYNVVLKEQEIKNIYTAFDAQLYDMVAEYIWTRTIHKLESNIKDLGEDFIYDLLDKSVSDIYSLTEYEVINTSADLGFISDCARVEFLGFCNIFIAYRDDNNNSSFPYTKLLDLIRSCIENVLGLNIIISDLKFNELKESFKTSVYKDNSDYIIQLNNKPYFYKRTITKTLLSLANMLENGAYRENVLANMTLILPCVWKDLSTDDKWNVGTTYANSNNKGDDAFYNTLKNILLKVRGFDFVPENLRSISFVKVGQDLLTAHFDFNNFFTEQIHARKLSEMGTSIPLPAFGKCITAVIVCKIGNGYGEAYSAQQYLDLILDNVTSERWEYYFNHIFSKDRVILDELSSSELLLKFKEKIIDKYNIRDLDITDSLTIQFLSKINTVNTATNFIKHMLSALITSV